MKILSLFDWMACWYEALLRAWIKIDKYYASEIDKYAIQIALKNHPDIIEIWDVCNVKWEDYQDIDLLIGGSPCQWFSVAGKQLNFNDPRSKLFFEFLRLKEEIKPKYFLLENVKMKKEFRDKISELLWVQPILIDSALLSAQHRERYYWTNIPWVIQPQDKWILLKDVLQDDTDEKYYLTESQMKTICRNFGAKWKILNQAESLVEKQTFPSRINQIWWLDIKCPTLCTAMWTWWWNVPAIIRWRPKMPYEHWHRELEYKVYSEKCPTLTENCASGDQKNIVVENWDFRERESLKIKNATKQWYIEWMEWDGVNLSFPNSNTRRGRVIKDKAPTIQTSDSLWTITNDLRIRKLTPIECERLQTLEDNYTAWVSDTQRYKMLGNWWTVDVIAHIFRFI